MRGSQRGTGTDLSRARVEVVKKLSLGQRNLCLTPSYFNILSFNFCNSISSYYLARESKLLGSFSWLFVGFFLLLFKDTNEKQGGDKTQSIKNNIVKTFR